jgi:hypothetical protein
MGCFFLLFGSTMFFFPCGVRSCMDRFADAWREGSWHPYKMPFWALRAAGAMVIVIAVLFFWIARMAFSRY